MANCSKCGASTTPEDRYCPQCGTQLAPLNPRDTATTQKSLDLSDVRFRLGMVYFRKGFYTRAAELWEKILEERPGDPDLEALINDARSRQETSEETS